MLLYSASEFRPPWEYAITLAITLTAQENSISVTRIHSLSLTTLRVHTSLEGVGNPDKEFGVFNIANHVVQMIENNRS